MIALAIETSCDETSLAILSFEIGQGGFYNNLNSVKILGQVISSQIKIHQQYGGVVPEIGARQHASQIHFLLLEVLNQMAGNLHLDKENLIAQLQQLDYIFVTTNPGLALALRVGLEFAKSLKFLIKHRYNREVELKEVNHLRGHIASAFFSPIADKYK